ncbi:MAG: sensor histidine kinase [Anaerolineales bacterium]
MSEALFASSLASHLAVAIAFVLLFGVATALPPRPINLRWSAAAVPIVGLRLTLVALLLINSWGFFDTGLYVSWLQWFAAAATALATGWVLLLPQPHPRWDSGLLAITTILVVGLSVSVGIDQLAGGSWPVGLDRFFGTELLRTGEALVYPVVSLLIMRKLIRGGVEQLLAHSGLRLKRIGGSSESPARPEPPEQVETLKAELRLALEQLAEVSSQTDHQDPIPVGSLTALIEGMRDPLLSIQGYGQMLAGGGIGELGPDQRKFVDRINDSTARVLDQLTRLLDLIRGGEALADGQADVIASVEAAVAQVAGPLNERVQSLHLELAESLPAINGAPDELRQILVTLIENAIQASPAGAVIPVSALATDSADGAWVSLSVSDSGGGIPPEELGRVFHNPEPGRGVESGLARVKQLAEGMGGRVWIGSEVGGGSTVTVLIPARQE